MKKYLKTLEQAASKKLSRAETENLVNYYEELITERLRNGEDIESIIHDYDVKKVVNDALTNELSTKKRLSNKNVWQVVTILFASPFLFPLAIIYLSLLIFLFSLALTGAITIISGLISIPPYLILVFRHSTNIGSILGLIAIGTLFFLIITYLGYLTLYGAKKGSDLLVRNTLKLIKRRNKVHEEN